MTKNWKRKTIPAMKNLKTNRSILTPFPSRRGGFLLLIGSLLWLGGCLIKPYSPVPGGQYGIENRFAIVQADSLQVILRPQSYSGDAQDTASSFMPVFLRVKNTSGRPVTVDPASFSLTANGKQYDYVPLELVLGSIKTSYQLTYYDDPLALNSSDIRSREENLERAREQYYELLNSYFSFGRILPGGYKEGYLFYNYRAGDARTLILDVMGTPVTFERR